MNYINYYVLIYRLRTEFDILIPLRTAPYREKKKEEKKQKKKKKNK